MSGRSAVRSPDLQKKSLHGKGKKLSLPSWPPPSSPLSKPHNLHLLQWSCLATNRLDSSCMAELHSVNVFKKEAWFKSPKARLKSLYTNFWKNWLVKNKLSSNPRITDHTAFFRVNLPFMDICFLFCCFLRRLLFVYCFMSE